MPKIISKFTSSRHKGFNCAGSSAADQKGRNACIHQCSRRLPSLQSPRRYHVTESDQASTRSRPDIPTSLRSCDILSSSVPIWKHVSKDDDTDHVAEQVHASRNQRQVFVTLGTYMEPHSVIRVTGKSPSGSFAPAHLGPFTTSIYSSQVQATPLQK